MSDRLKPTPAAHVAAQPSAVNAPVVDHLLQRYSLVNRHLARNLHHGLTTGAMLAQPAGPATWQELAQMQQAVLQQMQQLQEGFVGDWNTWIGEFAQFKRANTLSKLVELEFNLVGQFVQLLQNQATNWTSLMENVQVNYGYWVSQQLDAEAGSAADGAA